ncbi:16S rRNA (guanine(966)-N(2))-methyltransferase RsmD [Acidiphilium sp.]|uniref:16S rRNA (guanine(966)-N(2))-methyltransferase RsmD n=1 Tax=Acidiphilium sp. TaxID=527 RepID=UPI003D0827F2
MAAPRIIAGAWRGRLLAAPPGLTTRPTAGRVRQALFDTLLHAAWARDAVADRHVLDVFAGTGALGLEALSRGAAHATFIDNDPAAIAAIRHNIAACKAEGRASVRGADALAPPHGGPHALILLDPPYGSGLIADSLAALARSGWIAPGALIAAEFGRADALPDDITPLADRSHGAARLVIWRQA